MIARDQLRSIIDRVLRLKEEQDAIGEDVREVYAEAKSNGYDKTTLGKAVAVIRARRKKGEAAVAEADALLDMYLSAYDGTERATRTHAHARAQENPGDGLAGHSAPVEPSSGASPAPAGRAAEESPATYSDEYVEPHERINSLVRAFNAADGERLNEIARRRAGDRDMPPIPAFLDRTGAA